MTDQSAAWKQKYKRHLADNVARLGGVDITAQRRAIAREAAILQTEQDGMAQRFAAGNGGSREDLNLFTSISSTVKSLFESVGAPDVVVNQNAENEQVRAALEQTLANLIRVKREELQQAEA